MSLHDAVLLLIGVGLGLSAAVFLLGALALVDSRRLMPGKDKRAPAMPAVREPLTEAPDIRVSPPVGSLLSRRAVPQRVEPVSAAPRSSGESRPTSPAPPAPDPAEANRAEADEPGGTDAGGPLTGSGSASGSVSMPAPSASAPPVPPTPAAPVIPAARRPLPLRPAPVPPAASPEVTRSIEELLSRALLSPKLGSSTPPDDKKG